MRQDPPAFFVFCGEGRARTSHQARRIFMKKYMLALGLSLLTVLGLFTGCSPKARDGFGVRTV